MLEMKNRHLFVGHVNNDIFEKGYLCLYNYDENQENNDEEEGDNIDSKFNIEKIFYYFKDKNDMTQFRYQFENNFKKILEQNMNKILNLESYTKNKMIENIMSYLDYLNTLVTDYDHNNLIKYNDQDEASLSFIFFSNYGYYLDEYKDIKDNYNINNIKNEISISQEIEEEQND